MLLFSQGIRLPLHSINKHPLSEHVCWLVQMQHAPECSDCVQAKGQSSVWVQQVAVCFMGNWAEASVINCGKIATMQGGQALTEVAAAAASAGHNRQLEYELVRTMALLARDCPLTHSLGIDTWLRQLLYIAADAAAMKNLKLASQVGLHICIHTHLATVIQLSPSVYRSQLCSIYMTSTFP